MNKFKGEFGPTKPAPREALPEGTVSFNLDGLDHKVAQMKADLDHQLDEQGEFLSPEHRGQLGQLVVLAEIRLNRDRIDALTKVASQNGAQDQAEDLRSKAQALLDFQEGLAA